MNKKTTLWARNLWAGSIGTPPAPLSLGATDFVPRFLSLDGANVFKFNRRDVPYIKGAMLSSNFADGLLPQTAMGIKLSLIRFAANLTGTLANTAGSDEFTMAGGQLVAEACPGMVVWWVDDNGVQRSATIDTITGNTAGTFTANTASADAYAGNTTAAAAAPQIAPAFTDTLAIPTWLDHPEDFKRRLGTQAPQPATGVVRGELTISAPADGDTESILHGRSLDDASLSAAFNRDLVAGQVFRLNGRTLLVDSVDSQFRATISHPDPEIAASEAGIPEATSLELAPRIDDHLRILVEMTPTTQSFSTESLAAGHADEAGSIDACVEIWHSYFERDHQG